MKSISALGLAITLFAFPALAAPSADEVLSKAKAQASAEHKAIFVHFGASWCVWCRRLDAFLDRADIRPVFEKYFIPIKLVVQEKEAKKALENVGRDTVFKKLGGPDGLPYSAFLDANGALIVNSKRDGHNIGYPAQPEEIDWFVKMMRKASPDMPDSDLKIIEEALRNAKK